MSKSEQQTQQKLDRMGQDLESLETKFEKNAFILQEIKHTCDPASEAFSDHNFGADKLTFVRLLDDVLS